VREKDCETAMSKKYEFLDPEQSHLLSEQECNLVGLFRFFNETKRKAIFEMLFSAAMEDRKIENHIAKMDAGQ
jgi:hypothetical protein